MNPISLFRFASLSNLTAKDHKALQTQGLVYFIYLFLYSGLEFTLTFLTHNRFNFTSMQQVSLGKSRNLDFIRRMQSILLTMTPVRVTIHLQ